MELKKIIYPGRTFLLLDKQNSVTVVPISVKEIEAFKGSMSTTIDMIVTFLSTLKTRDGSITDASLRVAAGEIINKGIGQLKVIMQSTCDTDLNSLAHYDLMIVIGEWLDENLGAEEKSRPLLKAVNSVLTKFTGNKLPMLETLSSSLSKLVSSFKQSSKSSIQGSPTPDGAGSNITTGLSDSSVETTEPALQS